MPYSGKTMISAPYKIKKRIVSPNDKTWGLCYSKQLKAYNFESL